MPQLTTSASAAAAALTPVGMQVLGLDLLKSGFYSVLPWITMAIASNAAGALADTLIQRGVSVTRVRKGMQTVSCHVPEMTFGRHLAS